MKYYMPKSIQSWNQLTMEGYGKTFPINPTNDMGDFWMPAFKSKEECIEHFPNVGVIEVEDVK